MTSDHLGSPRINTDANGIVTARHDYQPFGEEVQRPSYGGDAVRKQFTSYERDNETELDYAKARYYAKNHGRFTTTDPLMASAIPVAPQTWNRFTYVANNPLKYVDPTGKCTAPSLEKGQVGICIEAFISTPKVQGSILGHGDGRSIQGDGNNPSLTNRIQIQIVLTATKDKVSAVYNVTAGVSKVSVPIADMDQGTPGGVVEPGAGFQGTASAEVNGTYSRPKGSENFGTTTLNVTGTAENGVSAAADDLEKSDFRAVQQVGSIIKAVGPPAGTIDFSANFKITGNGQVQFTGGDSKGYPTYAAYSYQNVNGQVQTTTLFIRPENKIEDLTKPMTPIPK